MHCISWSNCGQNKYSLTKLCVVCFVWFLSYTFKDEQTTNQSQFYVKRFQDESELWHSQVTNITNLNSLSLLWYSFSFTINEDKIWVFAWRLLKTEVVSVSSVLWRQQLVRVVVDRDEAEPPTQSVALSDQIASRLCQQKRSACDHRQVPRSERQTAQHRDRTYSVLLRSAEGHFLLILSAENGHDIPQSSSEMSVYWSLWLNCKLINSCCWQLLKFHLLSYFYDALTACSTLWRPNNFSITTVITAQGAQTSLWAYACWQ